MDNPNPIYYRDLITPDNAVTDLISQLETLIAQYEELRGKIQTQATATVKSMQGLSGATQEQREQIKLLSEESDKLLTEYRDTQGTLRALNEKYNDGNVALKEFTKIQKLVEQVNRSAEGSYDRLSAQYRLNKIRLNEMSEAQRHGTEAGRKLETETRKIYERMNELQKATGKAQLQVGQYERALGGVLGVNNTFLNVITDTSKATETFHGILGALSSPIGVVIGVVGAAVGAFKLWRDSVHETQAAGDALDIEVAGWQATWEVFRKSISTFDFGGFITGAREAAAAGRNLKAVLDETFERANSARILRASMSEENAALEEAMRNQNLSYEERIAAADKYLENMQGIYDQEQETARRNADAQLEYLFSVTNRTQYATDVEREAAKQRLAAFIADYNVNGARIKEARRYIQAEAAIAADETAIASGLSQSSYKIVSERLAQNRQIIAGMTDEQQEFVRLVKQYNLTSDADVKAYVDAEVNFLNAKAASYNDQKRIVTMRNNLEAQEEKAATDAAKARAKAAEDAAEAEKKEALAKLQAVVDGIQLEIDATETGTQEMLDLRLQKIEAQRALELEKNAQKAKELRQDEAAINAKYDRMRQAEEKKQQSEISKIRLQTLQTEQQSLQLQISITQDGTQEMLDLRLALIEKQREIELEQNRQKAEKMRIDEKLINAKYDALALKQTADFRTKQAQRDLKASQDLAANEFALLDRNERQKTIFRLQQEEERLQAILRINETATEKMTDDEVAAVKSALDGIKKQRASLGYNNLYEVLGLNLSTQQQSALNTAISSVQQSLSSLVSSWQAVANAAAEAAKSQVDAAKEALDAEIQARNEGYANNVKQAQKEYELSKKNLAKAQKEQERAQKAQIALDTVTQASSLITATANIWAAFSKAGMAGPALAAAATAVMWGSFLAAKIKAVQVAGVKKEEYGEGTVELLQGGSHASGHDIDLGTKKDGTRRRAEGGEYFAVINKRNSRKFGSVIPDVINAFNDGTFADKYQKAGAAMDAAALNIIGGASGTDVSRLEQDVAAIRKQGDETRFVDADGCTVIQYRNLTRKIRS